MWDKLDKLRPWAMLLFLVSMPFLVAPLSFFIIPPVARQGFNIPFVLLTHSIAWGLLCFGLLALAVSEPDRERNFNFLEHLTRQREWSERVFGPGERTEGLIDHIEKELREIREAPEDIEEWIDVVILALDGALRMGASPERIIKTLSMKQAKNERRRWPDWRTAAPGKAIEHVRDSSERALQDPKK